MLHDVSISKLITWIFSAATSIATNLANIASSIRSMHGNIIEFRAEVKNNINSMREDLNALNYSVSNLSMCLQEHKKQTETELADLHTSLVSTQVNFTSQLAELQTSLDSTQTNFTSQLTNHTSQLEKIQDDITYLKIIHGPYTCGGTGGWRHVVYLDMTDPNTTCPSGWKLTGYSKRTCGRATDGTNTCDSATFPVRGGEYSRICGRIRAYQGATPDGFYANHWGYVTTIDSAYVDGVSVTHGTPRNHIWTFADGLSESNPTAPNVCPCDASIEIRVPSFVGEDYFCESGVNRPWFGGNTDYIFRSNDTLWDGEDCLSSSTCCSRRNPPYFVKQLLTSTTDNIEARICLDQRLSDEDIAVELVELYVQWWELKLKEHFNWVKNIHFKCILCRVDECVQYQLLILIKYRVYLVIILEMCFHFKH